MRNEKTNRHKRKKTSRRTWKPISLALLCVVLALAAALVWLTLRDRLGTAVLQPSPVEMTAAPAQDPTEKAHKATFAAPAQQPIVLYADDGESVTVPAGPEIPGYTFLYWVDAAGNAERRQSVTVYEDLTYLGQYAVAFRDESRSAEHSPYLSLDESGLFYPNSAVTRGETVMALFQLLDINGVGSGYFADVSRDDAVYTAAATLKDLGLIEGEYLHAEDPMTYGELFRLLARLFPAASAEGSFDAVAPDSPYYPSFCLAYERGWLTDSVVSPYDGVSRRAFVRLFNSLTGRGGTSHDSALLTGTIADVGLSDADFSAIAEAVIRHDCAYGDGAERWTSSTPAALLDSGLFFSGMELRAIKDDGSPAVSESYAGLQFDESGVETTGDAALDALVRTRLSELVDPAAMTREEMLETVYYSVANDSNYLRAEIYAVGETGWEITEATRMLSTGKGNCYSYAATFWALARGIGYDAVCYSGTVGNHYNPHGWVEITLDDVPYIYDPTLQYEQWYGPGTHTYENFFQKTYESVSGWGYTRG